MSTNCFERSERLKRSYWSTNYLERNERLRSSYLARGIWWINTCNLSFRFARGYWWTSHCCLASRFARGNWWTNFCFLSDLTRPILSFPQTSAQVSNLLKKPGVKGLEAQRHPFWVNPKTPFCSIFDLTLTPNSNT